MFGDWKIKNGTTDRENMEIWEYIPSVLSIRTSSEDENVPWSALLITEVTHAMWLLSTWYVASDTGKLYF